MVCMATALLNAGPNHRSCREQRDVQSAGVPAIVKYLRYVLCCTVQYRKLGSDSLSVLRLQWLAASEMWARALWQQLVF